MVRFTALILGLILLSDPAFSRQFETINPDLLENYWPAQWIAHPTASPDEYGIYHFRKDFEISDKPGQFIVHVSGDNRYELFINGEWISKGPASDDLNNWSFETVDLAPHLNPGRNVLAARVWNGGEFRPMAWMTHRTAFILQGDTESEQIVNTDASWLVMRNKAYSAVKFLRNDRRLLWQYYVTGVLDSLRAADYPWDWEQPDFEGDSWQYPKKLGHGAPSGKENNQQWKLSPRKVPALLRQHQKFSHIARNEGVTVSEQFLHGNPAEIPPNSKTVLLIDNRVLTTGYPVLKTSRGDGSIVKLIYSEALYFSDQLADNQRVKGHRDEIDGLEVLGVHDYFIPDGGTARTFIPLHPRTFRWVQLEIETGDEPLILDDFSSIYTAYPSKLEADFSSDDEMLNKIWDAGWRTQEISAQETFVSDLFFERMQYLGDTKVQAMAWLYMTTDDRLVRLSLEQFDQSIAPSGLTQSRYPAGLEQYIPLYSLVWITMIHDYWMHRDDDEFTRQFLPGISQVLGWFNQRINQEGMLEPLSHFDYVDWTFYPDRRNKIADDPDHNSSAVHSLHYAWALEQAADLFEYFGEDLKKEKYLRQAGKLKERAFETSYDTESGLFSDSPSKQYFSMHSNIMAILSDAIPAEQQTQLLERMFAHSDILDVEMYFEFFLGRVLNKTGLGDLYIERLEPWENMISLGMGTFGETKENPRSECHAWSASPSYEFLATVAGVQPAEPGFRSVRIAPHLGDRSHVEATVPHQSGSIYVSFARKGIDGISAEITLPEGLTGTFFWNGESVELVSGDQKIRL